MCTCRDVARFFLSLQTDDASDAISNLKIQKLLYYAQGFHLALYSKPLFDEDFEAWEHGPVIPSLYHAYSIHKSSAIPKPNNFDFKPYSEEEKSFLREVYDAYGQYSAWALRDLSHQTTPWKETPRNGIISKEAMRAYFVTRLVEE